MSIVFKWRERKSEKPDEPGGDAALSVPELLKAYMQPAVIASAVHFEQEVVDLYDQFRASGKPDKPSPVN